MAEVVVRLSEGVGELVLNRPAQRNSLTGPLVSELTDGLKSLNSNPDCRVIVVSGAEGYFCAGLDLKAFAADPVPKWRAGFQDMWAEYHRTVFHTQLPVIGAIQGFAIAGGSSLALSCDFLVIGEGAFMHVSEVERNMAAPLNMFWLTRRYSYQVALRMGLLGERWTGAELLAAGLAEKCVADDQVLPTAMNMAQRFASFDGHNVRALKRSIQAGIEIGQRSNDFDECLAAIKAAAT